MQQGASDVSKLLHSQSIIKGLASEDKMLVTYKISSHMLMLESSSLLSSITEEALDWVDATGGRRSQQQRSTRPASPFDSKPRRRRRIRSRKRESSKERDRLPSLEPDGAITMMAAAEESNRVTSSRGTRMYRRFRGMWGGKSSGDLGSQLNVGNEVEEALSDADNSGEDNLSDSNANQVFAANEPRDSIVVDGEDLQLASAALPTDSCSENFSVKDQYRNTLPPVERWPDRPVIVRCSDDADMEVHIPGKSAYGALPINDKTTPIPFETPLFKGVAMIRIADLKTSPLDYFGGKVHDRYCPLLF